MASTKREAMVTPEGMLLFPALFEPRAFEGSDKETYSCVLVFSKDTDLTALNAAVRAAFQAKFPKGASGARNPLRDGDEKVEDWGEFMAGTKYIRCSSQFQPKVVDRRKQEILDESKVWSGCYARAVVAPYGYDKMGNKGVAFGLDAVQILREGEQVAGSGMAALKLFDEVADDAPSLDDPFGEI